MILNRGANNGGLFEKGHRGQEVPCNIRKYYRILSIIDDHFLVMLISIKKY